MVRVPTSDEIQRQREKVARLQNTIIAINQGEYGHRRGVQDIERELIVARETLRRMFGQRS